MKNISYSAWSKFLLCPRMFDICYNEELVGEYTTSALVFGSAIDESINQLLLNGVDPVQTFQENFKYEDMEFVKFHKKDLNMSLFTQDQADQLENKSDHYKSWAALRVRGRVLLEHYVQEFLPNITEIISVQQELASNRRGFLDLKAKTKMTGDKVVIIDNKASYYDYPEDAAEFGAQLALYAEEEGVDYVAFCVLLKDIQTKKKKVCKKCGYKVVGGSHKTCNKGKGKDRCHGEWDYEVEYFPRIQWIVGKPSQHTRKTMQKSIKGVERMIADCDKNGHYPFNFSTCKFVFGRQCEYYNYCHKQDKSGLVKREKK